MKRTFIRIAALLTLLMLLPALALAAQFAVVRGGNLNLRQYPNTNSYSLGKYGSGTFVQVTGSSDNGFLPVRTLDGKRGYMSAGYLTMPAQGSQGIVRYANGGYVNLRSGPSLNHSVVMRVTSGSPVYIQDNSYEWNYVYVYSNGRPVYGYMHDSLISSSVTAATVTTRNGGRVNVRSGPSSAYGKVGSLPSGTRVSVLLKGNNWYMISANGMQGFMSTEYLSGTGSTGGSNTGGGSTTSKTAWVNNPRSTQVLNLREAPSQSARSIGQYRNGTKVKVVRKGSPWSEVYVGTRHGYMMTCYLSFDGNYNKPSYPTYPSYPTEPSEPTYPTYPSYPTKPVDPPKQPDGGGLTPKAGDTVTLDAAGNANGRVNIYYDAAMTQLKGSYVTGTQLMLLQFNPKTCMVYIDGGVGYVGTMYLDF